MSGAVDERWAPIEKFHEEHPEIEPLFVELWKKYLEMGPIMDRTYEALGKIGDAKVTFVYDGLSSKLHHAFGVLGCVLKYPRREWKGMEEIEPPGLHPIRPYVLPGEKEPKP